MKARGHRRPEARGTRRSPGTSAAAQVQAHAQAQDESAALRPPARGLGTRARAASSAGFSAASRSTRAGAAGTEGEETPLARRLGAPARATPQDVFALALEWWTRGERFDIGRMAQALGVSRATVFRWVGSRELLYGEVLSALFDEALAAARAQARGSGPARIAEVTERLLTTLVADVPLRRFVGQDSEFAMRILMSRSSTVEQRCAASVRAALEDGVREGHIRPRMGLDPLAYLIVRIGESFLYRDVITGDPVDIDSAVVAIRILLEAR